MGNFFTTPTLFQNRNITENEAVNNFLHIRNMYCALATRISHEKLKNILEKMPKNIKLSNKNLIKVRDKAITLIILTSIEIKKPIKETFPNIFDESSEEYLKKHLKY